MAQVTWEEFGDCFRLRVVCLVETRVELSWHHKTQLLKVVKELEWNGRTNHRFWYQKYL